MTVVLLFHYIHESASQRKEQHNYRNAYAQNTPYHTHTAWVVHVLFMPFWKFISADIITVEYVHCVNIVEWKKRTTHVMLTRRPVATTYETLKRHNCTTEITSFLRKNVTTQVRLTSVKQKKMYEGLPTCSKHETTPVTVFRYLKR